MAQPLNKVARDIDIGGMKPSSRGYLDPEESQKEMLSHLDAATRSEWDSYGHLRIEPAFQDRVFIVYKATGRDNSGMQRVPEILAHVRVLSFVARDDSGCTIRLLNEETNQEMEVSHAPKKLFDYPVFVAIPVSFTLRWDAHQHEGKIVRTLSYLMLVKARNKADFFSVGNVYFETPNKMRKELYPHLELKLEV